MLPPVESRRALLRLFRKRPFVTLDTLLETLQTRSRMSVFRRLSAIDYLTSYSHAGRYYTLREIPEFDEGGLWHHLGVSFSRYGSLKSTVEHIVKDSEAGNTHPELELSLRVRVHNTLLDLVEAGCIGRVPLDRYFLYVSAKRRKAKAQVARRQEAIEREAVEREAKPTSAVDPGPEVGPAIRGHPRAWRFRRLRDGSHLRGALSTSIGSARHGTFREPSCVGPWRNFPTHSRTSTSRSDLWLSEQFPPSARPSKMSLERTSPRYHALTGESSAPNPCDSASMLPPGVGLHAAWLPSDEANPTDF